MGEWGGTHLHTPASGKRSPNLLIKSQSHHQTFYLKGLVPSTAIWKGGIKIKKIIKILNSKISRFSRESYKIENIKIIRHWLLRNLNVTGTIKCIIYHEHLASLIVKTLEQTFFELSSDCRKNFMHLFCDDWSHNFNLFERFKNQALQT